jgi:hypothetical protein
VPAAVGKLPHRHASKLTPTAADVGLDVTVVVTATDADGQIDQLAATPIGPIADPAARRARPWS